MFACFRAVTSEPFRNLVRTTGGLSYSLRFRWVFGQVVLISGFFVHQVLAVTGTVSANSFFISLFLYAPKYVG